MDKGVVKGCRLQVRVSKASSDSRIGNPPPTRASKPSSSPGEDRRGSPSQKPWSEHPPHKGAHNNRSTIPENDKRDGATGMVKRKGCSA